MRFLTTTNRAQRNSATQQQHLELHCFIVTWIVGKFLKLIKETVLLLMIGSYLSNGTDIISTDVDLNWWLINTPLGLSFCLSLSFDLEEQCPLLSLCYKEVQQISASIWPICSSDLILLYTMNISLIVLRLTLIHKAIHCMCGAGLA